MPNEVYIIEFTRELQFQHAISDLFIKHGWLVHCHPDSRASVTFSVPGFPDIVAAKGERLIFIECKMPGKMPSEAQVHWIRTLANNPRVEAYVWHPKDWLFIETRAKS